mgnify:CR=1 FL=1
MRFLMQRLLLFAAALFGISVLVFAMLRILPGDVAVVMAGMNASPARVAALRAEFGLDRPYVVQYLDWAGGLLHGDLGVSALTGRAVTSQVGQRATITFPLIVMSLAIALTLGLSMGAAAVISRSPAVRGFLRVLSIVGGGPVERPAAHPPVRTGRGPCRSAALAGVPRRWVGRSRAGGLVPDPAGAGHRIRVRCGHHALHALHSGRHRR